MGGKNVGFVLGELGRLTPMAVRNNLSWLMKLLQCENYSVRSGVVEMMGNLVRFEVQERRADGEMGDRPLEVEREKRIAVLMVEIMGRARDVNAFARSRVLQVIVGLLEEETVPKEMLLDVTNLGLVHVQDRAAVARKSALLLLTKVLEYNPFGPQLTAKVIASLSREAGKELADGLIQSMEEGCELAFQLLRSQSITDVQSAIAFLMMGLNFRLASSEKTPQKILPLLLCREVPIRECALRAFDVILMAREGEDERIRAMGIAHKLIDLTCGATVGELTCIAELVSISKLVDAAVVQVLVDITSDRVPNVQIEARRAAADLVAMTASVHRDLVHFRSDTLVELLRSEKDPQLVRHVCSIAESTTIETDESIANALVELIRGWTEVEGEVWLPVAEQAINALFSSSSAPEKIAAELLRELAIRATQTSTAGNLLRVVFAAGHVSIRQLVRIEETGQIIRKQTQKTGMHQRNYGLYEGHSQYCHVRGSLTAFVLSPNRYRQLFSTPLASLPRFHLRFLAPITFTTKKMSRRDHFSINSVVAMG